MGTTLKTEYCIVGAGPAGAVLASELAAAGKEVLVLEQGQGYGPEARAQILAERNRRLLGELGVDFDDRWSKDFDNAPVDSRGTSTWDYGSVAGVGGASLHWSASTPRPLAEDMQVRTRHGYGRDWPISYAELEPWLLRAEHELGVAADDDNPYASPRSGPFPMKAHPFSYFEREIFAPAARRLGWTAHSRPNAVNSEPRDGRPACLACRACSVCPSGARYSADRVHVPRFATRANARLVTGTKLLRLECAPDGRRIAAAHGVQIEGRAEVVVQARVFVLAMGGVETPRMLMLSRDDRHHPGGLGNAGGQLGVGFGDHLMSLFWMVLPQPVGNALGFPAMGCDHYRAHAPRERHGSFSISLYPVPLEGDWSPSSMYSRLATQGDRLSLEALRSSLTRGVAGYAMHELRCDETMTLSPDKQDAFGNPWPQISVGLDAWEREGPAQMVRLLGDMAGAFGAEVGESWSQNAFWFAAHPSGATAMGKQPGQGVCNPDLRVFGVDNLYLASASAFPHQGAANPTLTTVALALRLAAHLGAA